MHKHLKIGLFSIMLLPLAVVAAPDVKRGEKLYTARCGACHSIADNGAGPRHGGLFGCLAGTQDGYDYSAALRKSGIVWDEKSLDRWLTDPNTMVPGNKMVVQLTNDPADRADVIAWMRGATGSNSGCRRAAGK